MSQLKSSFPWLGHIVGVAHQWLGGGGPTNIAAVSKENYHVIGKGEPADVDLLEAGASQQGVSTQALCSGRVEGHAPREVICRLHAHYLGQSLTESWRGKREQA